MKDLSRESIRIIPSWPAGVPAEEVKRVYGIDRPAQLCYNENPYGPSPRAMDAMRREVERMAMYPDSGSLDLRAALAKKFSVTMDHITVANGMDDILVDIAHAFLEPEDEVLTCGATFYAYFFGAARMGAKYTELPLKDYRFDLDALADAITPRTKLVFICNPNNPTGTIVRKDEVRRFMDRVPEDVIVVFDQAYHEYVGDEDYADGLEYVREGRNVIVGRTFSKIYGLAGCRVGYCIAKPELNRYILKVSEVFPVNRMAQAAALAAMEDDKYLNMVKLRTGEGRSYLLRELEKLGAQCTESMGNYIFANVHADGREIAEKLKTRGVIITAGYKGYPEHLRITIGTREQNERLIAALRDAL